MYRLNHSESEKKQSFYLSIHGEELLKEAERHKKLLEIPGVE